MRENSGKLTLLPHGRLQSSDASHNKLLGLLLLCGSDHRRILDQRFPTTDRLIQYLSRIGDLRNPHTRAIVTLTQTCPITQCISGMRRALCAAFPVLESALWVIYADPAVDPAFFASARHIGKFDADLNDSPAWDHKDGSRYLVLTPFTRDEQQAMLRARMLSAQNESFYLRRERPSGVMNAIRAKP